MTAAARPPDKAATRAAFALDDALVALRDAQAELATLLERQRLALVANDAAALADLGRREQALADRMQQQERARRGHLAELTGSLTPRAEAPLTVAAAADRLPAPLNDRLRVHLAELRDGAAAQLRCVRGCGGAAALFCRA